MKLSAAVLAALGGPAVVLALADPGGEQGVVARALSGRNYAQQPAAGSYPNIPECSKSCYNQTVSTDSCTATDVACQCTETTAFQESFEGCVVQACTAKDQEAYLDGLLEECSSVGIEVPRVTTTAVGATASPTSTSTSGNYADIPLCSQKCFNQTLTTDGCAYDDVVCHCTKTDAFRDAFENCVVKDCGVPCQQKYQEALSGDCKKRGIDVPDIVMPLQTGFPAPGSPDCPFNAYPAVPECAQSCFNATVSTDGCCIADAACHCSKTAIFQDDFNACVIKDCPKRKDQKAYLKALTDSCSSVCVTVPDESQISLPPLPSATRRVKAARVRRDYPMITPTLTAASVDYSSIASSILGGLVNLNGSLPTAGKNGTYGHPNTTSPDLASATHNNQTYSGQKNGTWSNATTSTNVTASALAVTAGATSSTTSPSTSNHTGGAEVVAAFASVTSSLSTGVGTVLSHSNGIAAQGILAIVGWILLAL
ncbi:MAG: hypothetical protein M1832_002874 [Thelocarpon impressellum]|nr:MAG: hypothetical protein M1832_002874 [Thelocarpon impressellum]